MKNKIAIKLILIGIALMGSALPQALAASYVIGLSPYYDVSDREKVIQQTLLFMLQGASPGDDITVCDAFNLQVVTRASISQASLFQDNSQARARRLASSIVALKEFILSERAHAPELTGAIRLAEFTDLAGAQLRKPGQPLRVILIGSPLYVSEDSAFAQHDAYPSDAALTLDESSSPFSTRSRKNNLVGVTVHFAYLHNCYVNDFHRDRITRFLTLYFKEQSGCLATFAPDPSLAFQRAGDNIQQAVMQAELDTNDTKFEMRHVRARSIPVWFGPVSTVQNTIVSNLVPQNANGESPRPEVTNSVAPTITSQASNPPPVSFPVAVKDNVLGIGLMWSVSADIDLHVLPSKSARELYYGCTRTKEGAYFRDYRGANEGVDYEYVELKAPIDIRSVSAWANYFSGRAWPVRGKVIVYYEGKTYYGEFSLAAHSGNRGGESKSRGSSTYWVEIDLLKIVGLK